MKNSKILFKTGVIVVMLGLYSLKASATVYPIPNTPNSLEQFIEDTTQWADGDTIMLVDGAYICNNTVDIFQSVVIIGDPALTARPEVRFYDGGFRMKKEGIFVVIKNLRLNGLHADGLEKAGYILNCQVGTGSVFQYIIVENVEAYNFTGGIDGEQGKHSFYDSIIVNNVVWHDFSNEYCIDPNINFMKYIRVTNSTFYNCNGGFQKNPDFAQASTNDTIVPKTWIYDHNTFYNMLGTNHSLVQVNDPQDNTVTLTFTNNIVSTLKNPTNCRPFRISTTAGTFDFNHCTFHNFDATPTTYNLSVVSAQANITATDISPDDPKFRDVDDFTFDINLPLMTAGTDGGPIGDSRWVPKEGVTIKPINKDLTISIDEQMIAYVAFYGAFDSTVTWSVVDSVDGTTGQASIGATTGLLTTEATGKVMVKAVSNEDPAYADSLVLNILDLTLITSIELSAENMSTDPDTNIIDPNGMLTIIADILPADASIKTVNWTMSGTGTATITPITETSATLMGVDNGVVTVKGTATDGSGLFDTIQILITGQKPVLSVDVQVKGGGDTEITTNGGTLELEAIVLPDTAANKVVEWSVNDTTLAVVNDTGLVTARDNGTVTVTATATDGTGISDNIDVVITNQVGITQPLAKSSFRIIPNPANTYIRIESDSKSQVVLYNLDGKALIFKDIDANGTVNIQSLKAGMYIVKVVSEKISGTQLLIKEE